MVRDTSSIFNTLSLLSDEKKTMKHTLETNALPPNGEMCAVKTRLQSEKREKPVEQISAESLKSEEPRSQRQ